MRSWSPARLRRAGWIASAPLSVAYAGILAARSAWWARYAQTPPLPTISIGNLTLGGTGKTPFTMFLATRLRQQGLRPAIVSRGYGGLHSRGPRLVSGRGKIEMTPREAGDEPVMMAKSFEGPIAVARRRIDAIKLLAAERLADMVVLDDGFQHVRLRRDLDLLLMDQSAGLGNGWLLPAGPLRENPTAIKRADAIVLVQASGTAGSVHSATSTIPRGKPVLQARLEPSSLTYSDAGNWRRAPLMLDGQRVVTVSGVANPGRFHKMVDALGAHLLGKLEYPDHYNYGVEDWTDILAAAGGADMVITTEKDLVKLERLATGEVPLYALHLNVTMDASDERQLLTLVAERIGRSARACELGVAE